nr:glycogen debranching protein GlgX [Hoeflea marina]
MAPGGVRFTVRAPAATAVSVCLFDADDRETGRHALPQTDDDLFSGLIAGVKAGDRYGLRADGPWQPEQGHRFDRTKLLIDPYAVRLDRPFVHDSRLGQRGVDTADIVPKAVIEAPLPARSVAPPLFTPGGLIYELPVRAFTMLHPDVPAEIRGTLSALAHPAIIAHLRSLHVCAVELMPIAAWIDERHLPPLGLSNAWGYNPVTMLALDPRLAPSGVADLRLAVDALHEAGIGVLVDVVYNHTGESDLEGPTLSLRGLGNAAYYRHQADNAGILVNDTGCGNTLACDRLVVQELVLSAMRFLVEQGGVDGFRFDLAPILGRDDAGFNPDAALLRRIAQDSVLSDRVLHAEPWDIGPGGYQLGKFRRPWLEWNDRARDDIRRFWRGDAQMLGALATRLAGSSDVFAGDGATGTRTVNFIAAHDGFPLGDLVRFEHKHNEANGEENRDGHGENLSWNAGVEGDTADAGILAARSQDAEALIATLFASRGTILMTAGDEFGHSQGGNNNAYAQDNAITWRDWSRIDERRLDFTRAWARLRAELPPLMRAAFLHQGEGADGADRVEWLAAHGGRLTVDEWEDPHTHLLVMILGDGAGRLALAFNRGRDAIPITLPPTDGHWRPAAPGLDEMSRVPARCVACWIERAE